MGDENDNGREISYDPMVMEQLFDSKLYEPTIDKPAMRMRYSRLGRIWKTAIKFLTEKQLRIFYLRFSEGLKEKEIASTLHISQPMVSTCIRCAIKKLKKKIRLRRKKEVV